MGAPVLFLSTTPPELGAVRTEVARLLDEAGYVVLDPPAERENTPYEEQLKSMLGRCDCVVQLLGISYGPEVRLASGASAHSRGSHAELEREMARETGLPCYSFVLDEEFPYEETSGKPDPSAQVLQYRYRSSVKAEPRGWESVRDTAQLLQRLRLLAYRLEELRLASAGQVSAQEPAQVADARQATSEDAFRFSNPERVQVSVGDLSSVPPVMEARPPADSSGSGYSVIEPRNSKSKLTAFVAVTLALGVVAVVAALSLKGGLVTKELAPASDSPRAPEQQQPLPVPAPTQEQQSAAQKTEARPAGVGTTGTTPVSKEAEDEKELAQTEALLEEILRHSLLLSDSGDPDSPKDWMAIATRLVKKRHALDDAAYAKKLEALAAWKEKSKNAPGGTEMRRRRILCDIASWDLEQALAECVDSLREAGTDRKAVQDATMMLGHVQQLMGDDGQAAVRYAEALKTVDPDKDAERWCDLVHLLVAAGMKGGELELIYELSSQETRRKILAFREKHSGNDSLEVMSSLRHLGNHLVVLPGRSEEATQLLRRALSICEAYKADRDTPEIARVCMDLADSLRSPIPATERSQPDPSLPEILALQERALRIDEAWYGRESAQVAFALSSQAQTLESIQQLAKAEELYRGALAIREKLGNELNAPVVGTITGLAGVLVETNRAAEAEELLKTALEKRTERNRLAYLDKAMIIDELAKLYQKNGDIEKLEPLLRRAQALPCPKFAPAAVIHASLTKKLTDLLLDTKRADEAIPLMRDSEQWLALAYGRDDVIIPMAIHSLAQVLAEVGRNKEAEEQWRRAIALMEKQPRKEHEHLCAILYVCGRMFLDTRRTQEGEQMLRRAFEVDLYCENHQGKGLPALILTQHLTEKGKYDEAIELMSDSIEMMVKVRGNRDSRSILCLYSLSRAQMNAGYLEEARKSLELAVTCYEEALGPHDYHVAGTLESLSFVLKRLGQRGDEERARRRSLGIRAKIQSQEKDGAEELKHARESYAKLLMDCTRLSRAQIQARVNRIEAGETVPDLDLK